MTRPGERVRSIASRLFRPETIERAVDPIGIGSDTFPMPAIEPSTTVTPFD